DDAPLFGPVALQGEDKILECHNVVLRWEKCAETQKKICKIAGLSGAVKERMRSCPPRQQDFPIALLNDVQSLCQVP
ncbi:MAG: hypothetical protein WC156_02080, partial [Pedobacter sp.]